MSAVAVTGSTGFVGALVAERLSGAGVAQTLLVRDASRAPLLEGASVRVMSYEDRPASLEALKGHELLFMVSGKERQDRLAGHLAFVQAAADAGIQHIVYTSFVGAAEDATFTLGRDHWATEQAIIASGMHYTFLRDNLYLDFLPMMAGEDGVIRGPAADGRGGFVARTDVADVAAAVLLDPAAHRDAVYSLTGPESITLDEVAAILSAETGAPMRFERETVEEAYASRLKWTDEQWLLDSWVSTYTAIAAGEMDVVSDDVETVAGHPALSLREFLRAS